MMLTRHCKAFIAFHIGLAIWSFMTVPALFAESFNSRPLQSELEATVTFGIVCARGVNERCYATQTSTNPTYSVSPTNFAGTNGGWYLNNNLMSNLDLKAQALVPCYVDGNTANIVTFSVTGLWAHLEIGDRTNQFTGTPAIGTNPPTYGDYPWRIYVEGLQERYKVLNALKYTKWGSVTMTNDGITYPVPESANYGGIVDGWPTVVWKNRNGYRATDIAYTYLENGVGGWSMEKGRGKAKFTILFNPSNLLEKTTIYLYVTGFNYPGQPERYDSFEAPAAEDSYVEIYSTPETTIGTVVVVPDFVGDSLAILPDTSDKWTNGISLSGWSAVGVSVQTWNFNYCKDE